MAISTLNLFSIDVALRSLDTNEKRKAKTGVRWGWFEPNLQFFIFYFLFYLFYFFL